MARRRLALGILLLAFGPAAAELPGDIDPDRPDATNSARTVAPGIVQVEAGVTYARARLAASPDERRLSAAATLRIGLTERLEARIDGEPFVRLRGADDDTGSGDYAFGVKYRFLDAEDGRWWPALGVLPFVKPPIADGPIGSERPDFGVIALASFDLPAELGLDVNAGAVAVGQTRPNGYLVQALTSASLSRRFGAASLFVEVAFASRAERDGRDTLAAQTGVVYVLAPWLALDAAAGTSLLGPAPDVTVRAGLSARFGR
jgi:hypothetical protein